MLAADPRITSLDSPVDARAAAPHRGPTRVLDDASRFHQSNAVPDRAMRQVSDRSGRHKSAGCREVTGVVARPVDRSDPTYVAEFGEDRSVGDVPRDAPADQE